MKTSGLSIGAYEAKTRLSELLARVERGEEFTITKHGRAVARLSPVKKVATPEERAAAIERWIERRKGLTLGGVKIRDLIEEGRR